jgi:hypothetical protein
LRPACRILLFVAALPLAPPEPTWAAEPSPTTLLLEVYNAHMLSRFRRWADDYASKNGEVPASAQALLRQMGPDEGVAWLWLIDRKQTPDFDFQLDFVTDAWAIAASPKLPDSNLSLFLASGPQAVIQGGDAGRKLGNTALPPLDMRGLEKRLDSFLDGPGDLEALLKGLEAYDAQSVLQLKTGSFVCSMDELAAARAADHRLIPTDLPKSDGYFNYQLEGLKEGSRCTAWVFRAQNRIEAFPMYEVGSDRAIWVIPTWGPRKGVRIPFDQWKPTPR